MTAFFLGETGGFAWKRSYVEVPDSSGNLEAAIRKFEAEFDRGKLGVHIASLGSVEERDANWISLRQAAPDGFFDLPRDCPGRTLSQPFPLIENFEMTENILRLEVRNPAKQLVARFWIDVEARQVIRCVADAWQPAIAPRGRWSDDPLGRISVFIRMVVPASAHEEGRAELVKAWRGFPRGVSPVLVAEDPRSGQPFLSLAVNEGVYVLRPSGVTAVSIHAGGGLVWRESYVEMADSGKREAALKRIEQDWVNGAADEAILKFREAHRIDLASAAPRDFFFGPDTRASFYSPVIEKAEMTNNILRLGIRNPITQSGASFWIDLEARKVVKCVADGKELDLSIDRSGYDHEWKPNPKAGQFWGDVAKGGIYETHAFPGKPNLEIQIHGFTDAAFDSYLVGTNGRTRILSDLPCMKEQVGCTTNSILRKYEGTCSTTKSLGTLPRTQMYEAFWSPAAHRVAIAYAGYLVAAYDRVSGKTIHLEQYARATTPRHYDYRKCDADIAQFLADDR